VPVTEGANRWLGAAAVIGALAVGAGAFAAHGLKAVLSAEMLDVFKTGAQYQLAHALALGLAALAGPKTRLACWLFLAGIVLFCGSLYLLALTGMRGLGIVTPFGGVGLIAGWLALAVAAMRK